MLQSSLYGVLLTFENFLQAIDEAISRKGFQLVCVDVWVCGSEKERVQEEKNEECVDEWLNLGSRAVKPG